MLRPQRIAAVANGVWLEDELAGKRDHASAGQFSGNRLHAGNRTEIACADGGAVNGLRTQGCIRIGGAGVVEDIGRLHAKLKFSSFRDGERLENRKVVVCEPWPMQVIPRHIAVGIVVYGAACRYCLLGYWQYVRIGVDATRRGASPEFIFLIAG